MTFISVFLNEKFQTFSLRVKSFAYEIFSPDWIAKKFAAAAVLAFRLGPFDIKDHIVCMSWTTDHLAIFETSACTHSSHDDDQVGESTTSAETFFFWQFFILLEQLLGHILTIMIKMNENYNFTRVP